MKTSHKLAGAALLAALGLGLAAPSMTKAAPGYPDAKTGVGEGKIKFTTDDSTNPTNLPPGQSTGTPMTEPTQNPNPGPLKIVSVTNMDFDTHKIVANDTDKSYDALPFTDPGTGQTTAHFIRFQDIRADAATTNNWWTVKAKMTKQFTNANNQELTGATLDYKDITLVTGTNAATKPLAPATSTQTLALNAEKEFYTNREAGKGFGVFELMFDDNANAQAGTYDGITLNVPGTNVLKASEYKAEITWTIAEVI
ncbi:WxL domain-containing protein [Enterococcus sp. LJL51]|uniref:WxL domain-containing protein n=1 Tax=Enterococcus sp. LJL51 TaxID=3416656 RepID=UPI003CF67AAB